MRMSRVLLVFARAPAPGGAKTRLAPRLDAWRAARLQARLTEHALSTARRARCGPVELHVTPARGHTFFRYCRNKFKIAVESQQGTDLGERMHGAFTRALRRHRVAVLIGSDCPELAPRDLRRAARLLCGSCDAVLAPAEDGGYGLIALRRASRTLFEGMPWGGPEVYRDTVKRLIASGLRWRALRTIWDVDRPEDLGRLSALLLRCRSAR